MKLPKHKHKWKVIKTIWPYPHGWGTHCPKCSMVLDTGLDKDEAKRRCDVLNAP